MDHPRRTPFHNRAGHTGKGDLAARDNGATPDTAPNPGVVTQL